MESVMNITKVFRLLTRQMGRRAVVWLPMCFLLAADVTASVLVAPTAVYLTERDRTGRLTIQNPSDKPKEISIYLSFGIPESDSLGNVSVRLQDSVSVDPRSAAEWIRVFPRKFVLQASGEQVVRFVANPPADLADGEYWARIVIRSEAGQTSIPSATQVDGITTTLNMVMQTAIALKYRTGNLVSKVEVTETQINPSDSAVSVLVDMENRGNVSYVGLLVARLVDADRRQISHKEIDLAVYRQLSRGFTLPVTEGQFRRPYKVEISITNEGRKDIRAEFMIPGNSIQYSVLVE
jgi:P pilus assembly chaperone PapD